MKPRLIFTASILIASLLSLPAVAQGNPGEPGMQPGAQMMGQKGAGMRAPRDCTQAPNPEACQAQRDARLKAREACKNKFDPDRKQCLIDQQQNFDCSKAANPQQCEARKVTYKACRDQTGSAFRQCVQQKMPIADCAQAIDPQRCELNQKARLACKDKMGPEHKRCLRAQFGVK